MKMKFKGLTASIIALLLALSVLLTGCSLEGILPEGEDIGGIGGTTENGETDGSEDGSGDQDDIADSNGTNDNTGDDNTNSGTTDDSSNDNDGENTSTGTNSSYADTAVTVNGISVPAYSGSPYILINNGVPFFTEDEITDVGFESYSDLDALGRCGMVWASVGEETMPTEDRGSISSVYPSGWKYNDVSNNNSYSFVDGGKIYNRCHLLGFQLTGENANDRNLITGTRSLNIKGMLPFENMIADYVKETGGHVMYRVTPIFNGYNLVAAGVLMEGYSVEDDGEEIQFCVFAYNVEPGVEINYSNGTNRLAPDAPEDEGGTDLENVTHILNIKSHKIHLATCNGAKDTKEENREYCSGTYEEILADYPGYTPCGTCKPHENTGN